MKILVVPTLHASAQVEELQQHRVAEIQTVWDLYTQGICREFYARTDQPGAPVFMVERESVESARAVRTPRPHPAGPIHTPAEPLPSGRIGCHSRIGALYVSTTTDIVAI